MTVRMDSVLIEDLPSVEVWAHNPLVAGSSPAGPTKQNRAEECLHELRSQTGELLWRLPDVHDVYDKAPPHEDRRDGWVRGSDMEGIGVPLDQVVPYFACPKEREG